MGTSQSFRSGPNWSTTKRAITQIVNAQRAGSNTTAACTNYMRAFSNAVVSNGEGGHGGGGHIGGGFGHAGSRIGKSFGVFLSNVQGGSLADILNLTPEELYQQTKFDLIDKIRKHIIGEDDATMDDDAAKVAFDAVINKICEDCKNGEDVKEVFENALQEQLDGWIIQYYIEYIVEYGAELFQSHIFDKEGDAVRICNEIRNFLEIELNDRFMDELRGLDLSSPEGQQLLNDMINRILGIWGH